MNPTLEQIKTDESVWPEGATHYKGGIFYKKDAGVWLDSIDDEPSLNNNDWFIDATNRPTKAFVPEVGVECEYSVNGGDWGSCSLIASYKDRHWIAINDIRKEAVWNSSVIKFRPIKSEREKFVEAVDCLIKPHHWTSIDIAGALYDSGKFKLVETIK